MNLVRFSAAAAALSIVTLPAFAADEVLEDVIVTASRVEQPVSEAIGSVTVITREQIEQRQAQSLTDLLRGEAGVDVANNGGLGKSSAIFLRGGNATQTLILVDGVRISAATAGTTSIEFIPVDQIERIEIVRGPRSSLYGSDAIGGVIQIFTRRNSGISASLSVGSHNTQEYSTGFGIKHNSLRFNANGNYLQSEGFDACVGTYSGGCYAFEPDSDGYRNSSGAAHLGYAFGTVADLELSTLYAQGYTEFDGYYNQGRFRQSAPTVKLGITPVEALSITLQGGITADKLDNLNNGSFLSRYNTQKRNGSLLVAWSINSAHRITIGSDYLKDSIDTVVDPYDPTTVYADTTRSSHGEFAQYLGTLADHELSLAVRHDQSGQYGGHTTSNLGWKWFVLERAFTINAGYGKAFHAPTFNDLYFPWGSGNPNLKPESSRSIEVGASGIAEWFNWSLQTYDTKVNDLISLNSSYYPINTDARLRGVELTLGTHIGNTTANLNYSAQDPRSTEAGPNHEHLLARRARQSGRIDLGHDFGAADIATSINVVGRRYDNLANTISLAGYTTVDLKANIELGKQWSLQTKLANFLDRQYETVRYYNQEGRSIYVTLRYQLGK